MRIHTNLTRDQVAGITLPAGVGFHHIREHGSRSRARAFDVVLTGSSNYGGQYGAQDYAAGTWDEWGMFLAEVFAMDPDARVAGVYENAEHFHWATGDRYAEAFEPHKRHKWNYDRAESVTGMYAVHACTCGAIRRFTLGGYTWEDVA